MLEFYQAYADYNDLMDLSEEMFVTLAREVNGTEKLVYQGIDVDLTRPWKRIRFNQSLTEIGGAPEQVLTDRRAAQDLLKELHAEGPEREGHGKMLAKLFDLLVEPKLVSPTFITHYPAEISPLARRSEEDETLTDRLNSLSSAGRWPMVFPS